MFLCFKLFGVFFFYRIVFNRFVFGIVLYCFRIVLYFCVLCFFCVNVWFVWVFWVYECMSYMNYIYFLVFGFCS